MQASLEDAIRRIETRNPEELLRAVHIVESLIIANSKEFASEQDSFALNVAGRLSLQLEDLFKPACKQEVTLAMLRLLRGVCLVHRPSRQVFNNDKSLTLILEQGIKNKEPDIQAVSLEVLCAILVRQVEAIRRFEKLKGLKIICDVFKQSKTATSVKLAILQFLFFYLVPETKFPEQQHEIPRKTTHDKQLMLGRYLSNVDGLVRELETNRPFGTNDIEW